MDVGVTWTSDSHERAGPSDSVGGSNARRRGRHAHRAVQLGAALLIATRIVTAGSFERATSDLDAARSSLLSPRRRFAPPSPPRSIAGHDAADLSRVLDRLSARQRPRKPSGARRSVPPGARRRVLHRHRPDGRVGRPVRMAEGRHAAASACGVDSRAQPQGSRSAASSPPEIGCTSSYQSRRASHRKTLGTFTVGYALDDGIARRQAQVTHSDVNIIVSSAAGSEQPVRRRA